MSSTDTPRTGQIDMTREADADHTFGLVFRTYIVGTHTTLTRYFPDEAELQRFMGRNAVVEIDRIYK